jgi:hypothetical protein
MKLTIGTKVHYAPAYGAPENGVIKSHHDTRLDAVFVVYHCGNDWENYKNYTAALTSIKDLKPGWV